MAGGVPPPLPAAPTRQPTSLRHWLALLLSLCLGLFLLDAALSLADDSLSLFLGWHFLSAVRGTVGLLSLLGVVAVYGLMGLTPMIPKRLFLPVALFAPVTLLAAVPVMIYSYGRIHELAWTVSLAQVVLGLVILRWVQGGWKLNWPVVPELWLSARRFSWRNLGGFLAVNVLVLLPAVALYLAGCAALAVDHFSAGFLALGPAGVKVQVRTYVRADGKTIQLVPMSHVGEPEFYQQLTQSFPSNSMILMEGVTDDRNLLTNKISYKRMATTLGLAEQQREFKPSQGEWVSADVDVGDFAATTIEFLNVVMLVHVKGLTLPTVLELMHYAPPPQVELRLLEDLLTKRNRHLLGEIQSRLRETEHIIVPWGAAHIPELAQEIQKSGFKLGETHEYMAIRFRAASPQSQHAGPAPGR